MVRTREENLVEPQKRLQIISRLTEDEHLEAVQIINGRLNQDNKDLIQVL